MKIWLINHYAVPPQYYPLARPANFAKYLTRMGHEVKIIAASTVHNSDKNLIEDSTPWRTETVDGIEYVYIRCRDYQGNGIKRILNMYEFARKLPKVCNQLEKPDAIVATSLTPMACAKGIKIAHKYGCKGVAEIADLWPETLIAYGAAGKNNPAVLYLRKLEKWIYTHADDIVFTMEGAYDYIVEQGWQNDVPKSKVHYINNGVDLEQFEFNKEHYQIEDEDLKNPDIFKVVYTGAIRRVNNLGLLLDAAKKVTNPKIKFLIWGDGDELPLLKQRLFDEKITNVVFKGRVEKKYVPYIVSNADANIMHGDSGPLFRFGISPNKMFDYFAAGKPVIMSIPAAYNPVISHNCGLVVNSSYNLPSIIDRVSLLGEEDFCNYCMNSINASKIYSFEVLTKELEAIIQEV